MAKVSIFTDGACSGNPGPHEQSQKKWPRFFGSALRHQAKQSQKKWLRFFGSALRPQKIDGTI